MKRIQNRDAIRNVKKKVVSYLSICIVITLGLAGFLVDRFMEEGITIKAQEYYQERGFKNFEVISNLGITDDDLAKISNVSGVTTVEGVIQGDGRLNIEGASHAVTIITLTSKTSVPEITEGRLPEKENECIVGEDFASERGIKVGDKVQLFISGITEDDPLLGNDFEVVGLMHHPDYLRRHATNTVVIPVGSFDESATEGYYTRAFVATDVGKGMNIFEGEIFDAEAPVRSELESLTLELQKDTEARLKKKAEDAIDAEWAKAVEQLDTAAKEIDDGEKKLQDELASAKADLEAGEAELATKVTEGEATLTDAQATLDREVASASRQIENKQAELDEYNAKFKEVKVLIGPDPSKELEAMTVESLTTLCGVLNQGLREAGVNKQFSVDDYTQEVNGETVVNTKKMGKDILAGVALAEAQLAGMQKDINQAKSQLASTKAEKQAEIDQGWQTLYSEKAAGEEKIASGWAEYNSNKEKYEKEIADARTKLQEEREKGEAQVKEAKETLELPGSQWIVLDRKGNAGYMDVRNNIKAMRSGAYVFGLLFILISFMVCFSTITIIIEEQKQLVGTAKAFGFRKREVLAKYLFFGGSAGVLGCVLGILATLVGSGLMQKNFYNSGLYQFGIAESPVVLKETLIGCGILIFACILSTVIACLEILKSPASILMKGGTAQKATRQKTVKNKGGSLYSRLIIRNMLKDKARVGASIVIIAFSTLIIGMGFTLKFAFDNMSNKQVEDVYKYDLRVDVGEGVTDEERAGIEALLQEKNADYLPALMEGHLYNWNGEVTALSILSGDPERLGDFYAISEVGTTSPIEIPSEGLLVQNRMEESYGISAGTTLTVLDNSLAPREAEVKGTFQQYVGRTAVVSPEGYKNIFGEDYKENCYFIKLNGVEIDDLKNGLLDITPNLSFEAESDFIAKFRAVSGIYNVIIYLATGIAIIMSFMILTNLANIFVSRKKTELIVMRVNGFSIGKTIGYLARESVLTTLIGVALGALVGGLAAPTIIRLFEQPDLQFIRTFNPLAWAVAVGLEVLFALLINTVAFSRVKKFDLKDIA